MAKLTVLLLLVVLVAAATVSPSYGTSATISGRLKARKSRFLLANSVVYNTPSPSSYDCNKVCKHGRVCCGGRCIDLLSDRDNCGKCFNQCNDKCTYGFCDYAQ